MDCFDTAWKRNWPSIAMGLSYVIAIPFSFMFILWRHKGNYLNNVFLFRYGYLTAGFKPQFYWWNVFQILRKSALVMTIDLSNGLSTFLRMFLVIIMLVAGTFLEAMLKPRQEGHISRLLSHS
jgi:hypothetical protein